MHVMGATWLWLALATPPLVEEGNVGQSPRLAKLQKQLAAHDATALATFWKEIERAGAPLVEPLPRSTTHVLVTFLWRGLPTARSVVLWNGPASGNLYDDRLTRIAQSDVWAKSYVIRNDARFTYSFVLDSDFSLIAPSRLVRRGDPLNKHPINFHQSLLALPAAPPRPWLEVRPETPAGEVHVHRVGEKRRAYVYTPPGFSTSGKPYPLIVAFDAESALYYLPVTLDNLIAARKIPKTVALMVGNVDRVKDLGLDPTFADFLARDLVPWVRSQYHASADPRATVIQGCSLGGLAAAYTALRHPRSFGNVLSQSGALPWATQGEEPARLARDVAAAPRAAVRFWLEAGQLDTQHPARVPSLLESNRHLRDVLRAKGYAPEYREFAGGHDPTWWHGDVADGLIALLAEVPTSRKGAEPHRAGGVTIGPGRLEMLPVLLRIAALDGAAAALQKWRESRNTVANLDEVTLSALGYQLMENDPAGAIAVLRENAAAFTKSANAWDSLGEAYALADDRPHATECYQRSLSLDPTNHNARSVLAALAATRR